jgi:hypothetical protein
MWVKEIGGNAERSETNVLEGTAESARLIIGIRYGYGIEVARDIGMFKCQCGIPKTTLNTALLVIPAMCYGIT